jgi:hypothetical protein
LLPVAQRALTSSRRVTNGPVLFLSAWELRHHDAALLTWRHTHPSAVQTNAADGAVFASVNASHDDGRDVVATAFDMAFDELQVGELLPLAT